MMGRYKPNGIPWEGKSAVVPIAAVEDMRKMNHNWNWLPLEEIERTCRNVAKDKKTWFVCGECLYECSPPTMVKFCFNCGCKVVEL